MIDYAEPSDRTGGVLLMDSPSHDGEVVTGMVGAGAQIVVFTTGRGTPVGFPFVPVIKVTGNSRTYERMQLNLDFNAGGILDGTDTIDSCGEQLYRMVLETANGPPHPCGEPSARRALLHHPVLTGTPAGRAHRIGPLSGRYGPFVRPVWYRDVSVRNGVSPLCTKFSKSGSSTARSP